MRMLRAVALTAIVLLPLPNAELRAQDEVAPRRRVRITPFDGGRFTAVVRSLPPESLAVLPSGAAFGALAGAVVGAVLGATGDSVIFETCRGGCRIEFASVVGAIGGVFVGGAVGAAVGRERWRSAAGFTPSTPTSVSSLEPGARGELGERARLVTASGARISGTLASAGGDSVAVLDKAGQRRVQAAADIRRVDVARGTRSTRDLGGAIGPGLGAVTGYTIRSENAATAVVGGIIGAGVGVGVGSLIRRPRWVRVEPTRLGLTFGF